MTPKRSITTIALTIACLSAAAPAALAFDCGNASKPVGAGEKAVVSETGVVSISKSWQNQLDHGKTVDQLHGGFLGIDLNGDGIADADTYANPHGEIPQQAQQNGAPCHGVTSIEAAIGCSQPGA
jgi:hypothetical protein